MTVPSRLRLLVVAALPLLAACTTVVRPPATPAAPAADAVEVYLVDHGRTSSLVLPVAGDELRRYAYGDWRWYALGEKTSGRALAALFRPTQGALGREALHGPREEATVRSSVEVEIEAVHPLRVPRSAAAALAARLDELFRRRLDTRVVNEENGLAFVHHPVPYTLRHSSNRVVARWLREMGCGVRGAALLSRWRIAPAAPPPSATIAVAPDFRLPPAAHQER